MNGILIVLGVVGVLAVLGFIGIYNGLVRLKVLCDNAWSDMDVQLKRRHDLVPNLVETVKGYARHEQETFQKVVQARNQAVSAASPDQKIESENLLTGALRGLFALAEAYPELKANTNFLQLQGEIGKVEDNIANARRYYNAVVRDFNTKQMVFPSNLVAGTLGFSPRPFFEAEDQEREVVKVQF